VVPFFSIAIHIRNQPLEIGRKHGKSPCLLDIANADIANADRRAGSDASRKCGGLKTKAPALT
jgi:hypothetical protein